MDFDDALAVFGLNRAATWEDVRSRYRDAMWREHPDLVQGDGESARVLNDAFAVLELVYRLDPARRPRVEAETDHPPGSGWPRDAVAADDPVDEVVIADDGLALIAPADEVFGRLLNALGELGQVVVADPEAKYLEVALPANTGTLSVDLQGRNSATEAFFTLQTPPGQQPLHLDELVRFIAHLVRS